MEMTQNVASKSSVTSRRASTRVIIELAGGARRVSLPRRSSYLWLEGDHIRIHRKSLLDCPVYLRRPSL
jgi:hypothetical protein